MIKYTYALAFLAAMLWSSASFGQSGGDVKVGFEIGWSTSKMIGDYSDSEETDFTGGFHLHLYTRYYFTDNFGLQGGIQYAQRGSKYKYDGESYYKFGQDRAIKAVAVGNRIEDNRILNGYFDLPILAFYKINRRFEVGAGVYGGVQIVSQGSGDIRFEGRGAVTNNKVDLFTSEIDYNYNKDLFSRRITEGFNLRNVDGKIVEAPIVSGAYWDFDEEPDGDYFNKVEAGLVGHLAYWFNSSLSLRGKVAYGLSDVTNNDVDYSRASLNEDGTLMLSKDKDQHLSIQVSIGFSF